MQKTIEINTTQNVVIRYELATWGQRVLAFLLDTIILTVGLIILNFIFILFGGIVYKYAQYIIFTPILFFFTLGLEVFNNGATLGKLILGIKVVKVSGKQPKLSDYLLRWATRPIDIWLSLGAMASVLIASSEKAQRIGDMLANTAVIKTKPSLQFNLQQILSINTLEQYTPQYVQVIKLDEEDLILAKKTVESVTNHRNDAHFEALNMLVENFRERLEIKDVPSNKLLFLKTLINDYVVLTR